MKTRRVLFGLAMAIVAIAVSQPRVSSAQNVWLSSSPNLRWSVQVLKVDPSDVDMDPAFQVAIYENLVDELGKDKVFKQVLRDGDHYAGDVSDLLILKTTVQKYSAGSETKRAVTTVAGATKITVRTQLCSRDGAVVLERTVDGNVRFLGSNLRATHNLARNVAKAIERSSLPAPSSATPLPGGER